MVNKLKIKLPEKVKCIIEILNNNGFEAFAVGGCVRDSLFGFHPHDWDICTNAKPAQIKNCFADCKTFDAGIRHGTVSVVVDGEVFEITTYRIDGEYNDNRHPDNVTFTDDIEKDLARRDFTINAMAYNDKIGLIDPFNGQYDIKNRTVKCVGDPDRRFKEDSLRILRALRFASTYNLSINKNTENSLLCNSKLLSNITAERISSELNRIVCGKNAEKILNKFGEVFAVFIPEIKPMFNYEQHNRHHDKDLWRHTTSAIAAIESAPLLRITMLFHDLGKPAACRSDSDGTCHFKGHQNISAKMTDKILHRLKYPNDFINDCITLIKYHDVRFSGNKRRLKHVMSVIGEENVIQLLKVQRADIMAQSMYMRKEKIHDLDLTCKVFDEVIAEKECFTLKQLAVNGNDLINIGIDEGREIGRILKLLLDLVIEEKTDNEKAALLIKAAELHSNNYNKT